MSRTEESSREQALRAHLLSLLRSGAAHADFESTVAGITLTEANTRLASLPYTFWQVLVHMRIAQWDILEFSRNPKHESPSFPSGYWPKEEVTDEHGWSETIVGFQRDLKAREELIADPGSDLFRRFPHGEGQTLLREALLLADHNAYHLGALMVMKRLLKS